MGSITHNLKLNVPDFDQSPWDVDVNTNWTVLDAAVGMFTAIPNLVGVWKNSTTYTYGQSAIDAIDSSIWQCVQTHTSSDPPTAFSAERVLFPARWTNTAAGAQFYATQAANSAAAAAASAAAAANAAAAAGGPFLPIVGGTLTGVLMLSEDPQVALEAATKQYVDARVGGSGFLPMTGGTLTGALYAGSTGIGYMNIAASDRYLIAFGWNGNLYATANGGAIGNIATQAYVYGNFLPISGGTITGALTVNGEVHTPAIYRITNSGAYFYSDATFTHLVWDSGGWDLRYGRTTGNLQYLRGSDGAQLFLCDGNGFVSVAGGFNAAGAIVGYGNIFSRSGSIYWGASDRSHLVSDNGTFTAMYMLDAYGFILNWSTGTLQWDRYDGTPVFVIDPGGNTTITGTFYCPGVSVSGPQVTIAGRMQFGTGGSGCIMQFSPNWYWDWNGSNGNLNWIVAGRVGIESRATDGMFGNDIGGVYGQGDFLAISDERMKTDIQPSTHGLAEVIRLKPISFIRVKLSDKEPRIEHGFSAQQVRTVIPEAVEDLEMDGKMTLAVGLSPIVAALVCGMIEMEARINKLESR